MLSVDDILKQDELPLERVPVPEWGGDGEVFITTLRADERDRFETTWIALKEQSGGANVGFRAFTVATCLCNANGERVFDKPEEAYKQLGRKGGHVMSRLFNAASRLNGLTKADQEELAKNSSET